MRRWVLTILSVMSLLLCVAAVLLWVRGMLVADYLQWTTGYDAQMGNDFRRFWILNSGGGINVGDNLHLQGFGGFGGGAYRIPLGRHFEWERDADTRYPRSALKFTRVFIGGNLTSWGHLGCEFVLARSEQPENGFIDRTVSVIVPLPLLAGLTAILPTVALVTRLRKARRAEGGGCASCGYDLTGNISGVCPECGAACTTSENRVGTTGPP